MARIRRDIDQDFLEYLEYKISKLHKRLRPKENFKMWCKDIKIANPENCSVEYVKDHKQVVLKAFVDKNGRIEFDLYVNFGYQALSSLSKGLDLKSTFPGYKNEELFAIDFENKSISINLS